MADEKPNLDKIAAEIDMGRHDGELDAIFNAIRRRMGENLVDFVWTITVGGVSFGIADMSLMSLEATEVAIGNSWQMLNPETSAVEYKALLVCYLTHDVGWSVGDIETLVLKLGMDEIIESIDWVEVNPSPKGTFAS